LAKSFNSTKPSKLLVSCQQRFLLNVFNVYFFNETHVLKNFYSWGQRFLHLWVQRFKGLSQLVAMTMVKFVL